MQRDYNRDFELNFTSPTIQTRFRYNSYYLGLGSKAPSPIVCCMALKPFMKAALICPTVSSSLPAAARSAACRRPMMRSTPLPATRGSITCSAIRARRALALKESSPLAIPIDSTAQPTPSAEIAPDGDDAFNAYGFINTGVAFAPPVSNLMALRVGISMLPFSNIRMFDRLQLGTDLFLFGKSRMTAPIDEPTTDNHRYLAGSRTCS